MKKIFLAGALVALLFSTSVFAQDPTVALDFTKTDCDGVEHHLFSELEAGKVILLEFVMNCQSCESARIILEDIDAEFANSHPERFAIYTMSWTNSTTCEKMQAWPVVKNHMSPSFVGVADQVDYYGGFGMPTIVVVGGKDHQILYRSVGFPYKDSLILLELDKIRAAIALGLTQAAVGDGAGEGGGQFTLYPNPAHDKVKISLASEASYHAEVRIVNVLGVEVLHRSVEAAGDLELDISPLAPGLYTVVYTTAAGDQKQTMLVKQ